MTAATRPTGEDVVVLTLPMTPDRRLAGNATKGVSWRAVAALRKAQREDAYLAARAQAAHQDPIAGPVALTLVVHWGKATMTGRLRSRVEQVRPLDWDGCVSACKSLIDGALVDAGVIGDDRQIVSATVRQAVDPDERGFVVLTIEPIISERSDQP